MQQESSSANVMSFCSATHKKRIVADIIDMPRPKTTGVSWPWHLRHTQDPETGPAQCKFCERDVAKPRESDLAVCIYCALDRKIIIAVDQPFG